MLLSRLITWFKGHNTFSIFLLEIVAVFIGISASLLLDEWRTERNALNELDTKLRDLHYERQLQVSNFQVQIDAAQLAMESAILLGLGDLEGIDDGALMNHARTACYTAPYQYSFERLELPEAGSVGLRRAARDVASVDLMINYLLREREEPFSGIRQLCSQIAHEADLLIDPFQRGWSFGSEVAITEELQVLNIVGGALDRPYVGQSHNREQASRLRDDDLRTLSRQLVAHQTVAARLATLVVDQSLYITHIIDQQIPGIVPRFEIVGIDGTATGLGWQAFIAMQRDSENPALWYTERTFVEGELKFRADDAWYVNWGLLASGNDESAGDYTFKGDPSEVFPTGTAILGGQNIPVSAGHYRLTFNTETLRYRFDSIDGD